MITSIELKNFKSFREAKIDLERFTVFVGANASGKTSVLEAVEIAALVFGDKPTDKKSISPGDVFSGRRHPAWLMTRNMEDRLALKCWTPSDEVQCTVAENSFDSDLPVDERGVDFESNLENAKWDRLKPLSRDLFPTLSLKLRAAELAEPSYATQTPPRMESSGRGLASVLAYLKLNNPDGFDSLLVEFRRLMPRVTRIRFDKAPVQREEVEFVRIGDDTVERHTKREYQGDTILFDFENAPNVAAHAASEGTLILLGLLTVILGPNRPKILLLDDIEHGLHPLAQKNLIETINKLLDQFPDLQILATAHSPYLLDYLKPEQVRILTLDDQGHSVCRKLTDHPQFEKWKDEMAPGEMWSMFGEKWLTEGVGNP